MLRPPTSTLFPYTTLFRSSGRGVRSRVTVKAREAQDRSRSRDPSLARVTDLASSRDASRTSRTAPVQDRVERVLPPPDRKSTRLNSSHSQISYAVFCLKKK